MIELPVVAEPAVGRTPRMLAALRYRRTRIGTALVLLVLAVALLGPMLSPHGATEIVSSPFAGASSSTPLGADYLGRDVLSRVLHGGRSVVWMSLAAATIGVGVGIALGMLSGYAGGRTDELIMRGLDVLLAFPGLILALLFVSMLGARAWLIVLLVAVGWIPGVARVARGMAADLSGREFVVAAEIVGAPRWRIVVRELMPNLVMVSMVEFGLRLTWSIAAIAALSFLGLGIQPPAADWGLMMNENRNGLAIQPWAVMMPALLVAALTIGTNLVTEGVARTVARIDGDERADVAELRELDISVARTGASIVSDVDLTLRRGELVGLVGETGSGKTTIATALLAHFRRGATVTRGVVRVEDIELLQLEAAALRSLRGRIVAYVPQDPATSLTPSMRIGSQLLEPLEVHEPRLSAEERTARVSVALDEVRLPSDDEFLRRYPHQLSGGQLQRVAIAMAFVMRPAVIVLDEPTTGLDVSTQAHVLATVKRLCDEHQAAGLYVSHDLTVVAEIVDRIAVAYAGRIVEIGTTEQLLHRPGHPYTRLLFATTPDVAERRRLVPIPGRAPSLADRPHYCAFEPRCPFSRDACRAEQPPLIEVGGGQRVRCIRHSQLPAPAPRAPRHGHAGPALPRTSPLLSAEGLDAWYGGSQILHQISLSVQRGACVALVGQSGSGKTTFARCLVGAGATWRGTLTYDGEPLVERPRDRPRDQRREIQYIFQNPYGALNPRRTIGGTLLAHLRYLEGPRARQARQRMGAVLERVALPARFADRYPGELSGGERQRVGIARALISQPRLLVCDEITSALDVSVQAAIVNLLQDIQRDSDLAILFITHNIALVRSLADVVVVLNEGRVVEHGPTDTVLDTPVDPYTRLLVSQTPTLSAPSTKQEEV